MQRPYVLHPLKFISMLSEPGNLLTTILHFFVTSHTFHHNLL
ncbi:hypothetical protein L580_3724 [Serratia fonticola AU-P3(3)]|nr:hypothetical protein L580_3724 [Serratia fonticola AU-P3(3)]